MGVNADILRDYAAKCGLDVNVDDKTLLLSTDTKEVGSLERGIGYFVNLKYPRKFYSKKDKDGFVLYDCESGVFIVDGSSKRLLMFAPIYECNGSFVKAGIVSITGHEEAATVILNNLGESFSHNTR